VSYIDPENADLSAGKQYPPILSNLDVFQNPTRRKWFEQWVLAPTPSAEVNKSVIHDQESKQVSGLFKKLKLQAAPVSIVFKLAAMNKFCLDAEVPFRGMGLAGWENGGDLSNVSFPNPNRWAIRNVAIKCATFQSESMVSGSFFGDLTINNGADVLLDSCCIGRLSLNGVSRVELRGCVVLSLILPVPGSNPFSGDVVFSRSTFATSKSQTEVFRDAQAFRSCRIHLEQLQNHHAAQTMRALEVCAEREHERGLIKFFNYMQDYTISYGQKPERSLIYAVSLYAIMFMFVWVYDGGGILVEPSKAVGWLAGLSGNDGLAPIWRSFLLPLHAMTNPFGVFGIRTVVPNHGITQFVLTVYGLVADLLVGFSVFAIRKRFKLS